MQRGIVRILAATAALGGAILFDYASTTTAGKATTTFKFARYVVNSATGTVTWPCWPCRARRPTRPCRPSVFPSATTT